MYKLSKSDSTCMETNKYIKNLETILATESKWVKVHAAEFLLWQELDTSLVYDTYKSEEIQYDSEVPYRIGVWRVLYQASLDPVEKQSYLNKIISAYKIGQDKLHALETLAKLKFPISLIDSTFETKLKCNTEIDAFYLYGLWNLYYSPTADKIEILNKLIEVLENSETADNLKLITCYILRFIPINKDYRIRLYNIVYEKWSNSVQLQFVVSLVLLAKKDDYFKTNIISILDNYITDIESIPSIMLALSSHWEIVSFDKMKEMFDRVSNANDAKFNVDSFATVNYAMLKVLQNNLKQ